MDFEDLQELALDKARTLGHTPAEWVAADEASASARRTTCTRCGMIGYVRREHGLIGMAGELLADRCPRADENPGLSSCPSGSVGRTRFERLDERR
jgi:hypothetical protein